MLQRAEGLFAQHLPLFRNFTFCIKRKAIFAMVQRFLYLQSEKYFSFNEKECGISFLFLIVFFYLCIRNISLEKRSRGCDVFVK